ncbi:uncharacterized protein LOC132556984 [Ylistrum balloti]|uniref:uncharacterized protein LOC132556984 n=1 Tax=Ylistrum balloti TaxID=509963 RepID=UPI002905AA74|nr:uncharacterized protein LOC132556984 [Ylistrum balloti]
MDEEETKSFFGCFVRLQRHHRRLRDFITLLALNDVIDDNEYTSITTSMKKHSPIDLRIIKTIPSRCSTDRLLKCLSINRKLHNSFKKKHRNTPSPLVTPHRLSLNNSNDTYVDNFYELLKERALRSGSLEWTADFKRWTRQLSSKLQMLPCGTHKRNVADCFFVMLDLQAVIEKRHEADKSQLWMRPVFQMMETILCETSNPSLSRLIYQSRKGTACAQSHQFDEALKYASLVLCDVAMFSKGRQIGSCIFAVVNMYLQYYSSLCGANRKEEALDLKQRILFWIEVGYRQFDNEDSDMKKTWRRVYLDKKAFCHLGIDILSRDIPNAVITYTDITTAEQCIVEMMNLKEGMEKLRMLHFYVACGKVNKLKCPSEDGNGFYVKALQLAIEGKLHSEEAVLKEYFHIREASENVDETIDRDEAENPSPKTEEDQSQFGDLVEGFMQCQIERKTS